MIKHHFRELTKSFGIQIGPEKSEELKRTKTDVENNLTRILKLMKKEDQSNKDEHLRKDNELEGLIEDFYNQYQSLYALYGRLTTGEYAAAAVPRRVRRMSSVSSSSSDSEYFSSEEGDRDGYNRRRSPNLANTNEAFMDQLSSQFEVVESLNHQKRNLEAHVESQRHQVKQLSVKNTELHARVFKLQLLLKKTEGAVTVLHTRLVNNEDQAVTKITELMARINRLEHEAKSLRSQKGKMEEKIRRGRNEALSQRKEFADQLNLMQEKFDSAWSQNKELEAELENEKDKVYQHLIRIENLEEDLAETNSAAEERVVKEKECFLARIMDLELELESRCSKQNFLEEKLRETSCEIARMHEERKALEDRNRELELAITASVQVMDLRVELRNLQERNEKLELQNERSRKECSESVAKLEAQVAEQEETIEKQKEIIHEISEENGERKQVKDEADREKEKQLLRLREKVWELGASVSKEGGEKLNLMREVRQLEKKVGRLERNVREKDEELVALGEKKREAIRQLCFIIEFHRQRYHEQLKDLVTKRRVTIH